MDYPDTQADRSLYEIENYLIRGGASDFVHFFLRANYDRVRRGELIMILAPIDVALQRLVNASGKSLDYISRIPEGIDVMNNFLSSSLISDHYPIYTAINGMTFGNTRNDLSKLNFTNQLVNFGNVFIGIINAVLRKNTQQIDALKLANLPRNAIPRNGVIGENPVTEFSDFPNPVLRQIALNLSLVNVVNSCRISNQFNISICDSDNFWNEKMRRDYPKQETILGGSWKETYRLLTGKLYTFGHGGAGQLGHGDDRSQPKPKLVKGLNAVTAVSCGSIYEAVISNGLLYTFGEGSSGALGHGDTHTKFIPILVDGLTNVTAVSCGTQHTAAISNGRLYTFGRGVSGQLGHGDVQDQLRPKLVDVLNNVTAVSCGGEHTVVIADGRLYTFGRGLYGQLGHGDEVDQFTPKLVEGIDNVTFVSAGIDYTAIIFDGRLYTFGYGGFGQLGYGGNLRVLRPTLVDKLNNVTFVSAGKFHTAAISNGLLYTFGSNESGQLGCGNTQTQINPTLIEGLNNVTVVSCGINQSTAVIDTNRLYTFGYGRFDQLGHGDKMNYDRPAHVQWLNNVVSVSCGIYSTAAITL